MPVSIVDLFCGVGGLTKGLELSGLNVVAGLDFDETCKYAYETNNDALFFHRDITTVTGDELRELFPDNHIRVLVGCAPCQPFSKLTQRYRKEEKEKGREGDQWQSDNKWRLLYSFAELVREILPAVVSMENVPELRNEQVFLDFVNTLIGLGYQVNYQVVFCPDYGVPQNRKRLVLLASRLGAIELIAPTHTPENYRTVRDVIGELPPIEDGLPNTQDPLHNAAKLSKTNKKRIRQSVQGGTWHDWDDDLRLKCHKKETGHTYASIYGRMCWEKPSPTITTQFFGYGNGRFGHPEQNRALSMREGALLQSFPPDYRFYDYESVVSRKEVGVHIGNAVPVELGRAIGLTIANHLREVENHG
jgi:DNA-methyltransferase (dcm)